MNGFINTDNLSATQRIERAIAFIMADKVTAQFGPLVMFAGVRVGNCPTAYTDGRRIILGEEFIQGLTDPGLVYVILHEALHIAYRHLFVWRHLVAKDAGTANVAMDYVINLQLDAMEKQTSIIKMPVDKDGKPIGLLDYRFANMDTQQVFEALYKEGETGEGEGEGESGEGNGDSDDASNGQPGKQGSGKGKGKPRGGFDQHDHGAAEGMTEEEQGKIKKEIEQAIRHGSNLAGKLGGNVSRDLREILESQFDWREALADFIRAALTKGAEKTTFRRFNRRLQASGIHMPSTYDDSFRRIVVGIDTSGSIGSTMLAAFLGQVVKVIEDVKPEEVVLLYWDTRVAGDERYGGEVGYDAMLETTRPAGGGGTNPACVPKYLREHDLIENTECVLMLTDGVFFGGQGEWGGLPAPLWCVPKGDYYDAFAAEVGQSIPID